MKYENLIQKNLNENKSILLEIEKYEEKNKIFYELASEKKKQLSCLLVKILLKILLYKIKKKRNLKKSEFFFKMKLFASKIDNHNLLVKNYKIYKKKLNF